MAKPRKQCIKFFKIFLPEFSSKQLDLPPAFLKRFEGTFPKDAKLKDHTGKLWLVDLEESGGSLTITNGWQSFASENSLECGDFLIFKYDYGNCLFDVEIFGRSGCHKEALSSKMTTTDAMNGKEIPDEEICCVPTNACKQKDSKLAVKRGRQSLSLKRKKRKKRTSIGEDNALQAATYVAPEGPYFSISVCSWMLYVVFVPRSLLDSCGIKLEPEMALLDDNGKEWPGKVDVRKDGRVLINRGWASFREEHNLQLGDTCVFEIVLGGGNSSQKLRVQVIRSQAP